LDYDSDSSNASYEAEEVDDVGARLALDQLEGVEVGARLNRLGNNVARKVREKTGLTTAKRAAERKQRYKSDSTRRGKSQESLEKTLKNNSEDGLYMDYEQLINDYDQLEGLEVYDALINSHKLLAHRFAGAVKSGNDERGLKGFLEDVREDTRDRKLNAALAVTQLAALVSKIMADTAGAAKPLSPEDATKLYKFYWQNAGDENFRTRLAKKVGVKDWSKVLEPLLRAATAALPAQQPSQNPT
jgi:hypothetical protein